VTDLNFKAWKFDQTFLNGLDEKTWTTIISETQAQLTDSLIAAAVRKMPAPVYALNGLAIERKLIKRRDQLLTAGLEYYRFLASTVSVHGTDEREVFRLSQQDSGLLLTVYALKNGQEGRKLFDRIIHVPQTRELTLIALGGADTIIIEDGITSRLKVNIYGGKGADVYRVGGAIRTTIFENNSENNEYSLSKSVSLKKIKE
jgi:hypothetical protein